MDVKSKWTTIFGVVQGIGVAMAAFGPEPITKFIGVVLTAGAAAGLGIVAKDWNVSGTGGTK